ncbi:MAG: TetR/AcrR family transcriptional regulator [Propionibacteriaceae bacterium]|nr:TetR/AcrR family transcriptional regulator [Propionibacteriaceae bacterium]
MAQSSAKTQSEDGPAEARVRMTSAQRREQLIKVARTLFAEHGIDATSVEEIAAAASVSKPIVYEHFGSKDGLYAVVVDREVQRLETAITQAITTPGARYREIIERGALALLDYIDECPEGFRIISRDSSGTTGSFASILSDVTMSVEDLMRPGLKRHGFDPKLAGPLGQALVGLVAMAGQTWLETRKPAKDVLAAQLVNLAWNGLSNLERKPTLRTR